MSELKQPKIGVYGPKTRALQKRLSFERTALTWKTANVYRYLGDRRNGSPSIDDLDPVFLEIADRAYDTTPVPINIAYDELPEQALNLSRFGVIDPLGDQQIFRVHINSFDADGLGRYLVTGDVLEIPFLSENGRKAFFEIEDVDRKPEFENFYVYITAKPIMSTQETTEIPNIPTNSDIMDAIDAEIDAEGAADVTYEEVDDGTMRDSYDPRHDESGDFLDDPNATSF